MRALATLNAFSFHLHQTPVLENHFPDSILWNIVFLLGIDVALMLQLGAHFCLEVLSGSALSRKQHLFINSVLM